MKHVFKKIIVALLLVEARFVLKKYKPRIVAVTGSVGKTSTKDAVYTILSSSFYVRKSEKSFNSEIGIPLTVLGAPNAWLNPLRWSKNLLDGLGLVLLSSHYPHTLVLEVGADRPGDIKHVASWLSPDAVILTRFSSVPVHVEFFDSPEHVIEEKLNLVNALKTGGTLVLNFDDDLMRSVSPPREGSLITYGFMDGADLRASREVYTYEEDRVTGMRFRVDYAGSSIPVILPGVLGHQHVYPILAALALGISQGLNMVSMGIALKQHVPPPGRMRILPGVQKSVILDDTYNSSPVAAESALKVLGEVPCTGKKIAVLGDMMELGSYSTTAHRAIGRRVAENAEMLFVVGIRSHYTAESALESGMKKENVLVFNDAVSAGVELKKHVKEGDVVLVKGSQSMRMERVVEMVMAEPDKKKELLVRQDKQWLKRQ